MDPFCKFSFHITGTECMEISMGPFCKSSFNITVAGYMEISMDPFSKSSFYITDTGTWKFQWTLSVNLVFTLLILVRGNFYGPLR